MQRIQCRWAPSLGELEATHQEVWGTEEYTNRDDPTVFFGLYDLRDYIALWRHRGKKWVLWAGSDLNNLANGFIFNDGKLKWLSKLVPYNWWLFPILKTAEHWVENIDEYLKLNSYTRILARICPSYLGKFPQVSYQWSKTPNVYVNCPLNREEEYGFDTIRELAQKLPNHQFHIYGTWKQINLSNVHSYGRVLKERMNEEISLMQCGLRLNKSDGFSEITAKSVLMGQYPITYLEHAMIPFAQTIDDLISYLKSLTQMYQPNIKAREYYIKQLNNYPWNVKKYPTKS